MTHPLAHRLAATAPDWARRPLLAWDRDELTWRLPFVTDAATGPVMEHGRPSPKLPIPPPATKEQRNAACARP